MMDWYSSLETEDLVVPRGEDMLPSPTSWLNYGIDGSECSFEWINSFNTGATADQPTDDKYQMKLLFGENNRDASLQYADHSNTSSTNSGESENTSYHTNPTAHDRLDFHFNDMMGDADDIFLSSLLKDDLLPATELTDDSCGHYPEAQFSCLMPVNSNSPSTKSFSRGQVPVWSTNSITNMVQQNHLPAKAMESKVLDMTDEISGSGHTGREISLENMVLHDLKLALSQLPEKSRLCIRDSMYRLAHNSSQQMPMESQMLDKVNPERTKDEKRTGKETDTTRSETNTIDRAVANLMFNKVDLNIQDIAPAMSASSKHEKSVEVNRYCSLNPPETFHHHHQLPTFFLKDTQGPVFTRQRT